MLKRSSPALMEKLLKNSSTKENSNEQKSHVGLIDRLFLDIDYTLALRIAKEAKDMAHFKSSLAPYLEWFKERNLIIEFPFFNKECALNAYCIVWPGTYEFFSYVGQLTKLTIFSSGLDCINKPFVEEILIRSFGKEHTSIIGHVPILSRQNCIEIPNGTDSPIYRKNLSQKLEKKEWLGNVLLIDDSDVSCEGEENNCLLVPRVEWNNFKSMTARNILDINHIFYVTGLIDKALSQGREKFLAELNILQKKAQADDVIYWEHCLQGLTILQKINPRLELFQTKEKTLYEKIKNSECMEYLKKASLFAVPIMVGISMTAIACTIEKHKL